MSLTQKGSAFLAWLPTLRQELQTNRLAAYATTFSSQKGASLASINAKDRSEFLARNPEWASQSAFGAAIWLQPASLLAALGHGEKTPLPGAQIGSAFDFMSDDCEREATHAALSPFGLDVGSSRFSVPAFTKNDWGMRLMVSASEVRDSRGQLGLTPSRFALAMQKAAQARVQGAISQVVSDLQGEGLSLQDAQSVAGICAPIPGETGMTLSRQESPYGGSLLENEDEAIVRAALALALAHKEAHALREAMQGAHPDEPFEAPRHAPPRL